MHFTTSLYLFSLQLQDLDWPRITLLMWEVCVLLCHWESWLVLLIYQGICVSELTLDIYDYLEDQNCNIFHSMNLMTADSVMSISHLIDKYVWMYNSRLPWQKCLCIFLLIFQPYWHVHLSFCSWGDRPRLQRKCWSYTF